MPFLVQLYIYALDVGHAADMKLDYSMSLQGKNEQAGKKECPSSSVQFVAQDLEQNSEQFYVENVFIAQHGIVLFNPD